MSSSRRRDARNILSALFRDAFDRFATGRGLLPYELSGGANYYWFKQGFLKNDKIFYKRLDGEKGWRAMVGFKSLAAKEGSTRVRNWHFGIGNRPYFWPFAGLALRGHVAFTENGVLYDSKLRQHAARRNQCKSWYNDDWLDRMLATMSFLAGENGDEILIPLSRDEHLGVQKYPVLFESPISFQVMDQQAALVETDDEGEEDDTEEDEA